SDSCSEADDMCVSFGSLAQQGFPYTVCRPASRQASRQTVHSSAEKIASASFFAGLKNTVRIFPDGVFLGDIIIHSGTDT
ncbi:MAG: hypothetical protein IKU70_12865, partial [Clostridia bacterium]|nr:hypothetical protein [Clostridia bacterium]